MRQVWECSSTNGRWGAVIVSPSSEEVSWPAQGHLEHKGQTDGREVFVFRPDSEAATWVLPGGDIEVIEGAAVAYSKPLQSSRAGTILVLGPTAIIRAWGYKGRSSHITLWLDGTPQDCPGTVLVALGLIDGGKTKEIPPPPPSSGALADALRKAGYHKKEK